ncbi:hypothetical protein A2U01_0111041, partial [Trifolium medium]|nr:hypothetical protein [Trifolium medium]
TAPMPKPDASVSIMNSSSKLGSANMGASVIAICKASKAAWATSDQ